MRTIKFRGKRVDNGEWVYGHLLHHNQTNSVNMSGKDMGTCYIIPIRFDISNLKPTMVIPETVGQFTGLLDKNNTEIYEGDLLGRVVEGVKYYTNEIAHANCGLFAKSLVAGVDFFFEITTVLDKYEIVSNIHDNPELLKTD